MNQSLRIAVTLPLGIFIRGAEERLHDVIFITSLNHGVLNVSVHIRTSLGVASIVTGLFGVVPCPRVLFCPEGARGRVVGGQDCHFEFGSFVLDIL